MRLNTAPFVLLPGSTVDVISGAALSGLVGASAPSPRVHVKELALVSQDINVQKPLTLYKGSSGGSVSGTEIFTGAVAPVAIANRQVIPVDTVLEAGEYITAVIGSNGTGGAVVTVSAEIEI